METGDMTLKVRFDDGKHETLHFQSFNDLIDDDYHDPIPRDDAEVVSVASSNKKFEEWFAAQAQKTADVEHLKYIIEDYPSGKAHRRYSVLCVENGEEFRVVEKAGNEKEAFMMAIADAGVYGGKAVKVLGVVTG